MITNPSKTPKNGGKFVTIWKTGTNAKESTPITKIIRRERFGISGMYSSPCSSSLNTRKVDPFLNNQKWAIVNGTNILTKAGINT